MAEKLPPSIRSIAAKAGVTYSTVSLALRNDPRIPVATRERIQAVARELGYRPHPAITTLMTHLRSRRSVGNHETMVFVIPVPARILETRQTKVYEGYRRGASERATQLGFKLERIWAKEEGMSGRRLSEILHARGIRGVLLATGIPARGHLSLDWSKFAAATLGYAMWKPNLHRAAVNYFDGTMLALRTLRRRGYRRMGLILHAHTDERVNRQISAGFLTFRHHLPRKEQVEPFLASHFDEDHFAPWFRKENPDVVLAHAPEVTAWLRRCGKRIPDDIGFVHLQWEEGPSHCAGIRHNAHEVGAAGIDLVVGQLQRNETGIPARPRLVLTQCDWIEGDTVRS